MTDGWYLTCLPAGAARHPATLPSGAEWTPAIVPGTAAPALIRAGMPVPDLDRQDVWYRCSLPPGPRGRRLRFNGLATLTEAWLDDVPLLVGDSMFVAQERPMPQGTEGGATLHLRFRALESPKGLPRARWRPKLAEPGFLRGIRTTLLGRMPGSAPAPAPVGPYGGVDLLMPRGDLPRFGRARIATQLDSAGTGHLSVRLPILEGDLPQASACVVQVGGRTAPLTRSGNVLEGEIALPRIAPWWPHTHGTSILHDLSARIGPSRVLSLCRVGFRRIEVDRGADGRGFALRVNGVPVFCRGSAWTGAELLSAPGEVPDSREVIALARQAGMNMLRVPGTTLYPDPAFHRACDEAGVLVWQDFMFARFDYPAAVPEFRAAVEAEARQLLERLQGSPSLAVLCGGTEVAQQAAMLGLPPESWSSALYDHLLPAIASELRPDVPYVPNAPCGPAGELPFRADSGVAHYFGVTGYLRPFEDVRTADVRFAAECLAVSHVPDAVSCAAFGLLPHGAGWKAGVPRDMGASWDFEDVREHYLAQLYGVDPPRLRREDPERWLALSRAVTSDMLEAVFAEWRRPESRCAGGLTIALQDVLPGAGWGVLDARGRPKPAWHALRRAFRPVQLILLDEGMNGIALHVLNETAERISGTVSVDCWRGAVSVARGRHPVAVPPRGTLSLLGEDLFGGFFDAMNTWRFGPLQHDVVLACLDADGALPDDPPLASAALFPAGRNLARAEIGLTARLVSDHDQHVLVVTASRFAQGLIVEDEAGYIAAADHVHLAPGRPLRIALWPGRDAGPRPHGRVYALNAAASATYGHI